MRSLIAAIQFLTILSFGINITFDSKDFSRAVVYFPVVGLMIGIILAGVNVLSSFLLPDIITNLVLMTVLTVLTGGLHLDGLADSADGLGSGKNRCDVLEIMRDSRIGTMGVLSLIIIFLFKTAFLSYIHDSAKSFILIVMPVVGRWCLVLAIYSFKYAREEGKAKVFFDGMSKRIFFMASFIAVVTIGALKVNGLFLLAGGGITALLIGKIASAKLNGITGDVLGAIGEISEVAVLFTYYVFLR